MEKITQLNEERMRDVASTEGNVVYEYVYDQVGREADETQTVKLAKIVIEERAKLRDLSDELARVALRDNEMIAAFARDHEKTFELMTDLRNCGESYKMLCRLAHFKRASDQRGLSQAEATANVSSFLMEQCQRPAPA